MAARWMPVAGARSTAGGKWAGAAPCQMCLEQVPRTGPAAAAPAHAAAKWRDWATRCYPHCPPLCSMFGISCKACTATACTALDVTFKVRPASLRCCLQPHRSCSRCSAACAQHQPLGPLAWLGCAALQPADRLGIHQAAAPASLIRCCCAGMLRMLRFAADPVAERPLIPERCL